jgi:hypothetical protein
LAEPLPQIAGQSFDLGRGVHGTIYYVVERDGTYSVVATLDSGPASTPVRFEAMLADGQYVELSTPRKVGQAAQTVWIRRIGNSVSVSEGNGP